MTENFYEKLINDISNAINEKNYDLATSLINEELSMPYTPQSVLSKIQEFKSMINGLQEKEVKSSIMSSSEVSRAIRGTNETFMAALQSLNMVNVRNYIDVILEALEDETISHIAKVLLLQVLIDQQVNIDLIFKKDDKEFNINPMNLPDVLKQENFNKITDKIYQLTFKNPSFTQQAIMVATNAIYDKFPELIRDDEVDIYAFSCIKYVYKAYDDDNGFDEFITKYDINENKLLEFSF